MSKLKVLIVDDQTLMRDGLKTVLDLETNIEVVGTAKNGLEALKLTDSLKPEIILLDIRMPELDGVKCTKLIKDKHPEVKVIMLTTFNDEEYILDAIANGASGYLLKDVEIETLVQGIKDVAKGKVLMTAEVTAKLASGIVKLTERKKEEEVSEELDLSEREREIARKMVRGFTNKQIASALYISEGTARNYISSIYSKIGIGDRTQAVLFLKEKGIK